MASLTVRVTKTEPIVDCGMYTSHVTCFGSADERYAVAGLLQKEGYRPLPSSEFLLKLGEARCVLPYCVWTVKHTRSESGDLWDLCDDLSDSDSN